MIKLLIIADDFTGALDTGIQFTKEGIKTQVSTEIKPEKIEILKDTEVLVIDVETRKEDQEEAYEIVKNISNWAKENNIKYILKKTDSALRGNIGAELQAVVDVFEENIYFIPAFPKIDRITKDGIHYINNIKVSESDFGKDPFNPVKNSEVKDIIYEYNKTKSNTILRDDINGEYLNNTKKITIFDAISSEDIVNRLKELKDNSSLKLLSGCAGLAEFIPEIIDFNINKNLDFSKKDGVYISCGSLNSITKKQVEYASLNGYERVNLSIKQKLYPEYYETKEGIEFLESLENILKEKKKLIVDTFDNIQGETEKYALKNNITKKELRNNITKSHGIITKYLINKNLSYNFFVTGGDTLMGLMEELDKKELMPIIELNQGVVLSKLKYQNENLQIISKSGGFGSEDVYIDVLEQLII